MHLKKIPIDVQSLISASAYINNFTRAIEELIYNSLDADSTSIAIRVSIQESFIQVVDNGQGIKKENFCLLGQKYASSKYIDVFTLKSAPNMYGYRGLSLASIIEISQSVLITSRTNESDSTWLKTFHKGTEREPCAAPIRPSKGTTVEIKGFLYNLNIQRKSIDPIQELQSIKLSIEQLSLIHCDVSISLRDDYKNGIILKIHKNRDIYQTLWSLFEVNRSYIQELQVEKNNYKVKAFIGKENEIKTKKLHNQWIYLNGKFVSKTEVHKKVNKVFNKLLLKQNKISKVKNKTDEEHKNDLPFYFIFISCPFYDFDITYKHKQIVVEYKDWTEFDKIIEKLVQFYCGELKLKETFKVDEHKDIDKTKMQVKQIIDKLFHNNLISTATNIQHGIKGKHMKRKSKKKSQNLPNYSPLKFNKLNPSRSTSLKEKQDCKTMKIKKSETIKILNNKDLKKKYTTSKDVRRKSKNIDPIIDKFKNVTDSIKNRRKILSLEARNLIRKTKAESKTINITYTTEYKGNYSYFKESAVNIDYHIVSKTDLQEKFFRNNSNSFQPKTTYDLIKPFNQSDNAMSFRLPETQTMKFTYSSHHVYNSNSCKSLHPKNTFDSHSHQNYLETKKTITKHFITTNSRHNLSLQAQNCTFIHENIQRTRENGYGNRNSIENYDSEKEMPLNTTENTNDLETGIVNSYLHQSNDVNSLDKIDRPDLIDRQSQNNLMTEITLNEGNCLNKTYSVVITNNISENYDVDLTSISKETFLKNCVENEEKQTEAIENVQNHSELSQSLDPLNYCETIFLSNEMSDIAREFMNSFNINSCKIGSKYDLPVDNNNESVNFNLRNEEKEHMSQGENINLANDLHKAKQNAVEELNDFKLKKRHEFLPKGMSQIYKTRLHKKANISLSEIDYYENIMYDKFADDVLVKSKIFAPSIQNVEVNSNKLKKIYNKNDLIFNASSLKQAKIFGQIDRKFIATQIKGKTPECNVDFLVLFDQHAVDERLKLEKNLEDYFDGNSWRGVQLNPVPLKLDKNELLYLHNHRNKFEQFGLQWTFQDDRIMINSIPKAIIGKTERQEQQVLKAVQCLIIEEIDVIKTLGGNVTLYPKAIMDLVFSEACRYAIKFGDKLSNNDCMTMLRLLSSCKTPFQCAHGRPVMAVLMELPRNIRKYKVDIQKIKQYKSSKYI